MGRGKAEPEGARRHRKGGVRAEERGKSELEGARRSRREDVGGGRGKSEPEGKRRNKSELDV